MGIQIGTAIFDDGEAKFFIFDTIKKEAFCTLYETEIIAQSAFCNRRYKQAIPSPACSDKTELVTLFYFFDDSEKNVCTRSFANASRAYITDYRSIEHYQKGKERRCSKVISTAFQADSPSVCSQ